MNRKTSGRLLLRLAAKEFQADCPDYEKAFAFNQAAAKLGEPCARYNMGYLYENGLGREKDLKKAMYWYEMAGLDGMKGAELKLEELKSRMEGERTE